MKLAPLLIVWLSACGGEAGDTRHQEPQDKFGGATAVRITAPAEGETVEELVEVAFSAGSKVAWARFAVDDGEPGDWIDAGAGSAQVTVPTGRHELTIIGYDADKNELSRDDVTVKVVADGSGGWVTITSPADGAVVTNPVQFVVDASADVEAIELYADDWLLGTVAPGDVLTYTFSGTGYERVVDAHGLGGDGARVASDTVSITVEAGNTPGPSDFNAMVLDLVDTYPTDGSIEYWWPDDVDWPGTTKDLWYRDIMVAENGGYDACYCVGVTWEIFFKAWQDYDRSTGGDGDDLNGLSADDALDMRVTWYVRDLNGDGPGLALEEYGLGTSVDSFDDWRAGDFVQFWRTSGSGHQGVFIDWIFDDDGDRIGMEYFACNSDGPGYNDEYFGSHSGALDAQYMYAGRPYMPEDWR